MILTAHPGVDHAAVADAAPLVLDFRGVLRNAAVRVERRSTP